MSAYHPDIFGITPPDRLWSVFSAVSQLWNIQPQQQKAVLGGIEPQPPGSLPPPAEVATRIDLLKDCYLHARIGFQDTQEPKSGILRAHEWPHRPMRSFNGLSPLGVMAASKNDLLKVPIPLDFPHINHLWREPEVASETMGLEAMRGFVGRFSGASEAMDPYEARRLTAQLIVLGERGMNPP